MNFETSVLNENFYLKFFLITIIEIFSEIFCLCGYLVGSCKFYAKNTTKIMKKMITVAKIFTISQRFDVTDRKYLNFSLIISSKFDDQIYEIRKILKLTSKVRNERLECSTQTLQHLRLCAWSTLLELE